MTVRNSRMLPLLAVMSLLAPAAAAAQHEQHGGQQPPASGHEMAPMYMRQLGGGWHLMGMAQAFPIYSTGFGADANEAVTEGAFYLTQPVLMMNVESPGSRLVLRTTWDFEGLTQEDGELTFGGWGEGFLDKRHPHTLLHEAMLSLNFWGVAGGDLSLSAGKGFAPYGTDDPMSRPAVKYPTNHHLSQVLERYTVNGVYVRGGLSVESGLFGGNEPTGPYDFENWDGFPNSWSARLTHRFGADMMPPWEISASYANVVESHDDDETTTKLVNAYIRHERPGYYALLEASRSDPDYDEDWWSVLAEMQLRRGAHQPYARAEVATRPEFEREGAVGTEGFFRYDHDAHPIGASRWFIGTLGYNYHVTGYPWSIRPFVEVQFNNVAGERGDVVASELFGTNNFVGLTAGARIYIGGDPMRMGAYGALDAMTRHMRMMPAPAAGSGEHRH